MFGQKRSFAIIDVIPEDLWAEGWRYSYTATNLGIYFNIVIMHAGCACAYIIPKLIPEHRTFLIQHNGFIALS